MIYKTLSFSIVLVHMAIILLIYCTRIYCCPLLYARVDILTFTSYYGKLLNILIGNVKRYIITQKSIDKCFLRIDRKNTTHLRKFTWGMVHELYNSLDLHSSELSIVWTIVLFVGYISIHNYIYRFSLDLLCYHLRGKKKRY